MSPTDAQRKRAIHHIVYEMVMFKFVSIQVMSGVSDQALKNILLESFSIHARNLFDFFYKSRARDDIVVEDFISNKRNFKINATKKVKLKIVPKKANKQVSHLTYSRINYNKRTKPWKVGELDQKFAQTIKAFLLTLSPNDKILFDREFLLSWGIADAINYF